MPKTCSKKCADLLLRYIGNSIERREQLIEFFEHLPLAAQQRFLDDLKALATGSLDTEAQRRMANKIREKVHTHRCFSHTHWALPSDVVDILEGVQRQFEPQDVVARYAWLFDYYPRLSQESPELSRKEQVWQGQREVLEHILITEGLAKILALTEAVEDPYTVGFVLGKAKLLQDESDILPSLLTVEQEKITAFARGYVEGRFASWEGVEQLPLATWSVEQVSAFAQNLPCERRTWDLMAQLGNDSSAHYWQHVSPLPDNSSTEDVEHVVAILLQHHRPWHAIRVLGRALHNGCPLRRSLFAEALEAGLRHRSEDGSSKVRDAMIEYDIQELIRCLQSDPAVDIQRLAALEWGYLRLLDGYATSPKALYMRLQQAPQFFVKLLHLIFPPQQESAEAVESPMQEQKARALNAYTLLRAWDTVPGTRKDGTVDATKLMEWVTTARGLCEQTGRLAVCDSSIGKVFAHSPQESDSTWPCISVRDVI